MASTCLPEVYKVIQAIAPQTDGAGRTSTYVSLANAHRLTLVASVANGEATALTLTFYQAQDVSAAGETALTVNVPLWRNANTATGDALTRLSDGVAVASTAAATNQQLIAQIDPQTLAAGFDSFCCKSGGDAAANLLAVDFYLESRYGAAVPPSAIT